MARLLVACLAALVASGCTAPSGATPSPRSTASGPAPVTAAPTLRIPEIVSTIRAGPPLIVSYASPSSPALGAWDAAGHRVGAIETSSATTDNGCVIAPDGSKIFTGDGKIFDIAGNQLADVSSLNVGGPAAAGCRQPGVDGAYFLGGPIWADDSRHICGFMGSSQNPGQGTALLEIATDGTSREVADILGGGQLVACSPTADRAVVVQSSGNSLASYHSTILAIRLSTGAVETRRSVAGSPDTATHDGRLVALSGSTGITVYDLATGRRVAHVVRHGDEGTSYGVPDLAHADIFSWDGSRLLVVADAANGAFHPAWIVSLPSDTNVLVDAASLGSPWLNFVDGDVVPLLTGAEFFLDGRMAGDPNSYTFYFLNRVGHLQPLR